MAASVLELPPPPPITSLEPFTPLLAVSIREDPLRQLFVHLGLCRGTQTVYGAERTTSYRVRQLDRRFERAPNAFALEPDAADGVLGFHGGAGRGVTILQAGEPVTFARYILRTQSRWFIAEPDPRLEATGDSCSPGPEGLVWREADPQEQLFWGPDHYQAALTTRLRGGSVPGEPDLVRRARNFFIGFELRTHRALVHWPLQEAVNGLMDPLIRRAHTRVFNGQSDVQRLAIPECDASELERVARVFHETMEVELGTTPEDIVLAAGLFAAGQLRWPMNGLWITQPSSGLFLLFGELALAACSMEDPPGGRPFWEAVALAFIAAREVFVDVYKPNVREDGLARFRACAFQERKSASWDQSDLLGVSRGYAPVDLETRAGSAMKDHFPAFCRQP